MTFSNTSKTLRKEKGLSQVQLAEALNISKACISMIEIGKKRADCKYSTQICRFFPMLNRLSARQRGRPRQYHYKNGKARRKV